MTRLKLHFFSALLLWFIGNIGISYWFYDKTKADALSATLHNQLLSIRNRWEHSFAIIRQEALAMIDQRALPHLSALIAVRTFQMGGNGDWTFTNRVRHAPGDTRRLEMKDFTALDRAYPIPFDKITNNEDYTRFARLPNERPILRYATRIGDTIYVIEVNHEPMTRALEGNQSTTQFVVGSAGDLMAQSDPKHFILGEDLRHMPLTESAFGTKSPTPTELRYKELPSRPTQISQWCYSKLGHFILVSQSPAPQSANFFKNRETWFSMSANAMLTALSFFWIITALRVHKKKRAA